MNSEEYEQRDRDAKRRRLRKGTHSCWECKRRKVRCTFASATDATCITCRRRGTKCVSQELPEEVGDVEDGAGRMGRVEALLNRLVQQIDHGAIQDGAESMRGQSQEHDLAALEPASVSSADANPTPSTSSSSSSHESSSGRHYPRGAQDASRSHSRPSLRTPTVFQTSPAARKAAPAGNTHNLEQISQALLTAFPIQNDIEILLEACNGPAEFCFKVSNMLHGRKKRVEVEDEAQQAKITSPRTHPVLIAKYMLILCSLTMGLSPRQHVPGLAEHHRVIMERLADAAIRLVTTNEELLGTVESLECILLEALYHLNCMNIQRAWLAFRRAMVSAQLIGICRPHCPPPKKLDPDTNINPQVMWSNIVYMDRFLSLTLALPPGHTDVKPETTDTLLANGTARDTPRGWLEGLHSKIIAKILERNQLGLSERTMALTLEIDRDLRKAAESLPADFWRLPVLTADGKDADETFRETMRIRDQVTHFTLVNQLHLPYLLGPDTTNKQKQKQKHENEYSRSSCVYASREILTRINSFRAFYGISTCCGLADYLALIAGVTLILAHLDNHRYQETDQVLTHQRLGDRATMKQALDDMEANCDIYGDTVVGRCADLLRHLLRFEADAAQRQSHRLHKAQETEPEPESNHGDAGGDGDEDECNALFITSLYFGSIKIGRNGIQPVDTLAPVGAHVTQTQDLGADFTIGGIGSVHIDHSVAHVAKDCDSGQPTTSALVPAGLPMGDWITPSPQSEDIHAGTVSVSDCAQRQQHQLQLTNTMAPHEFMMQPDAISYPGGTAAMPMPAMVDDWAFSAVDTAFFDRLMMPGMTDVQAGAGAGAGTGALAPDWVRAAHANGDLAGP